MNSEASLMDSNVSLNFQNKQGKPVFKYSTVGILLRIIIIIRLCRDYKTHLSYLPLRGSDITLI